MVQFFEPRRAPTKESANGSKEADGVLVLGKDKKTPITLVRDDEYEDRFFFVVGPKASPLVRFVMAGADIVQIVERCGKSSKTWIKKIRADHQSKKSKLTNRRNLSWPPPPLKKPAPSSRPRSRTSRCSSAANGSTASPARPSPPSTPPPARPFARSPRATRPTSISPSRPPARRSRKAPGRR